MPHFPSLISSPPIKKFDTHLWFFNYFFLITRGCSSRIKMLFRVVSNKYNNNIRNEAISRKVIHKNKFSRNFHKTIISLHIKKKYFNQLPMNQKNIWKEGHTNVDAAFSGVSKPTTHKSKSMKTNILWLVLMPIKYTIFFVSRQWRSNLARIRATHEPTILHESWSSCIIHLLTWTFYRIVNKQNHSVLLLGIRFDIPTLQISIEFFV